VTLPKLPIVPRRDNNFLGFKHKWGTSGTLARLVKVKAGPVPLAVQFSPCEVNRIKQDINRYKGPWSFLALAVVIFTTRCKDPP
jgi:hypothetical protein